MKKTFIKFRHAPKIVSKRLGLDGTTRTAAYLTDAEIQAEKEKKEKESQQIEIKTAADVLKFLNETKAALEETMKNEVKAEVKEATEAKLAEIEKKTSEVKGLPEDYTAEQLKKDIEDFKITMKAFDRFQINFKRQGNPVKEEAKSFEQLIAKAIEDNGDKIAKFERKEIKSFDMEVKVDAVSTASVQGSSVWGAVKRPGIVMIPNTRRHVRSLIPVLPAGANPGTDFYFMRELANSGVPLPTAETQGSTAATTQATGLKPQIGLNWKEDSVKFEYIAGWTLVSRKAMNNLPGFSSYLQQRLPELLMDAEDQQILYGNGTSPQIKGILASGNYQASTSSSTKLIEKIIDDISELEDTHKRLATGIALRPKDYYGFFKNTADGSGEYDLPQGMVFADGTLYIFGIPVAKTTALTTGDYVVGDFQNGTQLYIGEAMRLEFFEQDDKNVRTNQVTVRIEEYGALPVYGDNFFIKGSSAES